MSAEMTRVRLLHQIALVAAAGDPWNTVAALRQVAPRVAREARRELAALLRQARRDAVEEHGARPHAWGSPLWRVPKG